MTQPNQGSTSRRNPQSGKQSRPRARQEQSGEAQTTEQVHPKEQPQAVGESQLGEAPGAGGQAQSGDQSQHRGGAQGDGEAEARDTLEDSPPQHLWKVDGYLSWLTADTTYAFSGAINSLVFSLLVIMQTGSAAKAGVVSSLTLIVAGILKLFGGWIQDSFSRKSIAIINGLSGLGLYGIGVFLLATGNFTFLSASLLAICLGIRSGLCGGVMNVMLRSFVPGKQLPKAISVNLARDATVEFAVPPIGGALLQLGKVFSFTASAILNGLGALASFFLPQSVVDVEKKEPAATRKLSLSGIFAGLKSLLSHRFMIATALSGNLLMTFFNAMILVTIWRIAQLAGSSAFAGLVNTSVAVGVFVGAIFASKIVKSVRGSIVSIAAYFLPLLTVILLSLFDNPTMRIVALVPAMFLLPAASSFGSSVFMFTIPNSKLGRASAAAGVIELIFSASVTAGIGFIYQSFGYPTCVILGSMVMALCFLHLVLIPEMRQIPHSDDPEQFAKKLAVK